MVKKSPQEIALDRINEVIKNNRTGLDLSGLGLVELPQELWQLQNLMSLDIGGNKIHTLPTQIKLLWQLNSLDLSYCELKNLPSEIFSLNGLTFLDLTGNDILTIPRNINKLSKLSLLNLSNNKITSLPDELWELTELTSLDLGGNKSIILSNGISNLSRLSSLDLGGTDLTKLPTEISYLPNLDSLDLSGNRLIDLPAGFGQLKNLTSLKLISCEFTAIPPVIWELNNLKSLEFSYNKLADLSIEVGKLTKLNTLYISDNLLTSLPAEIGLLSQLENFSAYNNQLENLPKEFSRLGNLKRLNLGSNRFKVFPNEILSLKKLVFLDFGNFWDWGDGDNAITEIPSEIGDLENLEELSFHENRLIGLPDSISKLTKLKKLILGRNNISTIPSGFSKLTQLEELMLWENKLISIPFEFRHLNLITINISKNQLDFFPVELCHIATLENLYVGENNLRRIPLEIEYLINLKRLGMDKAGIKELPQQLKNLKDLEFLNIKENDLQIPPEILDKTEDPKLLFNYYFDGFRKYLNESKVIIVGQGSVGKTSLIHRIVDNSFDSQETKTDGIAITKWSVENQLNDQQPEIKLNIWDFGGQEIMHATHQFFLTKRSLYLLVLDSRLTQEENRVEYWLKIIQSYGGESPIIIIGNKVDQHPLDIDRNGLKKKYPSVINILETSAATGAGIEKLIGAITRRINDLPHIHDLLPESWLTIKTKLEELGKQSNFITHDKYLDLCAENEVSDETSQRTLIGFLHDLGVVLHFQDDPRLEALGILNPQWVTNGVYKILNSHSLFQNKGVLTTSMLDEILNLPEYPRGKRLFIVDMMKKFELCYDIEPDKTFLVPDLLPKDQPELQFNGIPAFEYAYPVLPSSVITRFIVRMNQKIDDGFVWRTGVVLKIGENKALVKADIEDRKITITIDGVEYSRRDALSAIRYELGEIHNSIKGLNPQQRVPVPNAPLAEPLKYEYLLKLERAGQETVLVENGNDLVTVNVRQMLSAIESEAQRKEQGGNVTHIYIGGNVDGNLTVGNDNQSNKD